MHRSWLKTINQRTYALVGSVYKNTYWSYCIKSSLQAVEVFRLEGMGQIDREQVLLLSLCSLMNRINVCAMVGLSVHTAAPYSCGGGGDGVVLNDLLLRAHWCRTARWTGLWTEVTLGLLLHSGDGAVLVCEEKLLELRHLIF